MSLEKLNLVLLVDDDSINNFINERLIKKIGISEEVKIASNGDEALTFLKSKLKENRSFFPDLILLDINMPVMDGFEFLREYGKLDFPSRDKVSIIMLTTSTNPGDLEKFNRSGVAAYVNKPLTEEKLKDLMVKHFAW